MNNVYCQAYVANYPDMPDLLDSAPLVPSRVQYDKDDNLIRYGHQVRPDEEGAIQWFKLMLAADDCSTVRTKVEEVILKRAFNEDAVISDFLGKIFEAVRTHLPDPAPAQYVEAYVVDILAAQPSQGDGLGKGRYVACLRSAAAQAGLHIRFVHVYSESRAVARSSIVKFDTPGHYLYCVHDGGGGTTHLQMDLIAVDPDSSKQREELFAPHYLSKGGEDTNVLYEKYIRNCYPDLTEVQMAAYSWSLDPEAKALLPADFVFDDEFSREVNEHVFEPVLDVIIAYLVQGFSIGGKIALQRHSELLEQDQDKARHPRRTIWNFEPDETNENMPSQLGLSQEHEQTPVKYETIFVSSEGQSADFRLQKKLQEQFAPHWRCARNPWTGVVDGLLLLHTDRQEHPQEGAWARCAYGYIGWSEANSQGETEVEYNEDLRIFEARTPSYLIQPVSALSRGHSGKIS
ncbi:hypothetical protein LTR41_011485 [Exophiala xenobiotica]|nr:hypothetical protein LTR41_011485 [Exophiala xenobiotica]KAK5550522.1 hypothetical protein LTR46_011473 [Exophiala xenobiotica]